MQIENDTKQLEQNKTRGSRLPGFVVLLTICFALLAFLCSFSGASDFSKAGLVQIKIGINEYLSFNYYYFFLLLLPQSYWLKSLLVINQTVSDRWKSGSWFNETLVVSFAILLICIQPVYLSFSEQQVNFYSAYGPLQGTNLYPIAPWKNMWPTIQYLLWISMQTLWPTAVLFELSKRRKIERVLVPLALLALLFTLFRYDSFDTVTLTGLIFLYQFSFVLYFKHLIANPDRSEAASISKEESSSSNLLIIPLNTFAAFKRWRKQQELAMKSELKNLAFVLFPVLIVGTFLTLNFVQSYERDHNFVLPVIELGKNRVTDRQRSGAGKISPAVYSHLLGNTFARNLKKIESDLPPWNFSFGLTISTNSTIRITNVHYPDYYARKALSRFSDDNSIPLRFKRFDYNDQKNVEKLLELAAKQTLSENHNRTGIPLAGMVSVHWQRVSDFKPEGQMKVAVKLLGHPTQSAELDQGQNSNASLAANTNNFAELIKDYLIAIPTSALVAWLLFLSSKPSDLELSSSGIRLIWRRFLRKSEGKYLPWSDMARICVQKKEGSTSPHDGTISFIDLTGAAVLNLKMEMLESIEDRENLLFAINKWAREAAKDPTLLQALQAPADHSYTELWLQALSAPPKRERLKPLAAETSLYEGRYEILEKIGGGGQGNAYLAETMEGDSVVLKETVLPVFVDINVRKSALSQFENEARLLKELHHDKIVQLVDFFVEDHRSYLVLEHINGKSLRSLVKENGAFAQESVLDLAKQMAEILAYLHNLNPPVVHRDFSPDNLILRDDGTLKLIDFNVAKQMIESTTSGTVVGKHAYLPPEQFRGMPVPASDIYAMGATLHYLLCGLDPEPISQSSPKQFLPSINLQLNAIIEKATALDLAKRYARIEELQSDLNEICAGLGLAANESAERINLTENSERLSVSDEIS